MDQQLFNLARLMSVTDLTGGDPKSPAVVTWATWATAIFLIGWGAGGLIFGVFGDRIGRVRTLTMTILLYAIFTGLSALSVSPWDYCVYRFLTGMGVGGVFAAAVALLAETMPSNARPFTLGLMQASSAIGNCTAAGLFVFLGLMELNGHLDSLKSIGLSAWRVLFLIGLAPAVLVILIQRRLHEPESWRMAQQEAATGVGKKLGSYRELFNDKQVRRNAILGLLLSFAGVVGLWGIGFFSIDLQQRIFPKVYAQDAKALGLTGAEAKRFIDSQRIIWAGVTSLTLNVGAFFGMAGFSWLAHRIGRRPAFAITFVGTATSVAMLFLKMETKTDILWMTPLMGFWLLALFGGYAIYLPELFPTRLRSTGTSFCYNVGRFVAATGPVALGILTNQVFAHFKSQGDDLPSRYAGVAMCSVFLIGLAVLPFLPETKDQPLPD